jgi:hypothetical protein
MEEVPFERVLGPGVGKALGNLTERNGVTLKMKSLVDKFEPSGISSFSGYFLRDTQIINICT